MHSRMHQIAPFLKKFSGSMPPNLPNYTPRNVPMFEYLIFSKLSLPMFEHQFAPRYTIMGTGRVVAIVGARSLLENPSNFSPLWGPFCWVILLSGGGGVFFSMWGPFFYVKKSMWGPFFYSYRGPFCGSPPPLQKFLRATMSTWAMVPR